MNFQRMVRNRNIAIYKVTPGIGSNAIRQVMKNDTIIQALRKRTIA